MRETHTAQTILFDFYPQHEFASHLQSLSSLLDSLPEIIVLLAPDLMDENAGDVGRKGLSVESVLRCLLLKQKLGISYQQLAFHLSDSPTYRGFARLSSGSFPSKSSLQANIRRIQPDTLESIFKLIATQGFERCHTDLSRVRGRQPHRRSARQSAVK